MPTKRGPALSLDQHQFKKRAEHSKAQSERQVELPTQHSSPKSHRQFHNLPSPYSDNFLIRKREEGEDDEAKEEEPLVKQTRLEETIDETRPAAVEPVEYWVRNNCQWSDCLKETTAMSVSQVGRPPKKRSNSSSSSWRQSTLSGDTPKAWGRQHAAIMLEKGIFMDEQMNATVTEDDARLCKKILEAQYELPDEWRFQEDNFLSILKLALHRNERRVVRDVGPHIMPSPELLREQGHPGLEHIAEAVDAQWSKCTSLCGPKSTPDVSHGLSRFVFTPDEREKLTMNNTCLSETMMFPFYVCEAKCFDKTIEESELQALHSASVASNTVIELYEKLSAAKELDRRILAFSVSHNQRLVKIFAHFALIDGRNISFHRYELFEADLLKGQTDRHRPYHIALGIWEHFYPLHLKRVQSALARQQSRTMESSTAALGLVGDSASGVSTPLTSQENSPAVIRLQQENQRLLNRMLQQSEDSRLHQIELESRLDRQSEQHKEQMKVQSEQHREQMKVQSEQHKEQMTEITALFKAARS